MSTPAKDAGRIDGLPWWRLVDWAVVAGRVNAVAWMFMDSGAGSHYIPVKYRDQVNFCAMVVQALTGNVFAPAGIIRAKR